MLRPGWRSFWASEWCRNEEVSSSCVIVWQAVGHCPVFESMQLKLLNSMCVSCIAAFAGLCSLQWCSPFAGSKASVNDQKRLKACDAYFPGAVAAPCCLDLGWFRLMDIFGWQKSCVHRILRNVQRQWSGTSPKNVSNLSAQRRLQLTLNRDSRHRVPIHGNIVTEPNECAALHNISHKEKYCNIHFVLPYHLVTMSMLHARILFTEGWNATAGCRQPASRSEIRWSLQKLTFGGGDSMCRQARLLKALILTYCLNLFDVLWSFETRVQFKQSWIASMQELAVSWVGAAWILFRA